MQEQLTPVAFSGNIPVNYDAYLGPMFFEPYALDMANRISKIPAAHILELASGTGRLTKLLPTVVTKNTTIIASDLNPAMVNYGRNKADHEIIKWLEIDAQSLPFKDESFDAVIVQFGVMFYSDRMKAFEEALRVLKPGGVFIFNCWDEIKNNPMPLLTNETLQHFFPENTPAFYSIPFSYYDEIVIQNDLKEAGFENIEIELLSLSGFSNSAKDAAKGLIEGTPTITAIEERDAQILPELMRHLEQRITETFGNGILQVPLRARVVTARKPKN